MFCRLKKDKKKSGIYEYYYLVENQREGKKVKQNNILYFGKDKNSCEELRKEINKQISDTTKILKK